MSKFTYLESPMTIRGKVYRNRLIAAPTLFAHSVFFLPEIEMCIRDRSHCSHIYFHILGNVKERFLPHGKGD